MKGIDNKKIDEQELLQQLILNKNPKSSQNIRSDRPLVILSLCVVISLIISAFFDKISVNRAGIILNLLSAFMIAPEILETRKLIAISDSIRKRTELLRKVGKYLERQDYIKRFIPFSMVTMFLGYSIVILTSRTNPSKLPGYLTGIAPFAVAYSSSLVLLFIFTYLTGNALDYFTTNVAFNRELRSSLSVWGIIFLILGSFLQFVGAS